MDAHQSDQRAAVLANSVQDKYWLYSWIDDEGIQSPKDLRKALRKPRLIEALEEYSAATTSSRRVPQRAVVPSTPIDLSATFGCYHHECLSAQVQSLFSKTWHYFDTVIIDGPLIGDLRRKGALADRIDQQASLLLYLRKIGAEPHIAFNRKVRVEGSSRFREYAAKENLGLDILLDREFENQVAGEIKRHSPAQIEENEDGSWSYLIRLRHDDIADGWYNYTRGDRLGPPSEDDVIRDFLGRYFTALISDVSAARALGAPLLQPAEELFLEYSDPSSDPMDRVAALELRLPVLANIPVKDILTLRQKYSAEFERFRLALQKAMEEQLARRESGSPDTIARNVVDEYVTPELARIESKLKVDRKALAKKIGANVAIAGTAVSVGSLTHVPLVIASGVAAVIPAFGPLNKYFDDRGQIELSDLYFLWRARVGHRGGHR